MLGLGQRSDEVAGVCYIAVISGRFHGYRYRLPFSFVSLGYFSWLFFLVIFPGYFSWLFFLVIFLVISGIIFGRWWVIFLVIFLGSILFVFCRHFRNFGNNGQK